MLEIKTAEQLLNASNLNRDQKSEIYKTLEKEEQKKYNKLLKESFFSEDNMANSVSHISPSGKYRLEIKEYKTSDGCWHYTRGIVYNGSEIVADVKRNYSSFPFLWIENHINGHDYLLCGEDYQGQTFCELDTRKMKSLESDGADQGYGFCWAGYELMPDNKTLLVEGCHWAAPYEYRLFDISDPMNGWPRYEHCEEDIENEKGWLDCKSNTSVSMQDGLVIWEKKGFVFKQTGERRIDIDRVRREIQKNKYNKDADDALIEKQLNEFDSKYPDQEDSPGLYDSCIEHRLAYSIENKTLVLKEEYMSDGKKKDKERTRILLEEAEAARKKWRAEDVFLPLMKEKFDKEHAYSYQPSLNDKKNGDINPIYFVIEERTDAGQFELKWGHLNGDIKVDLYLKGNSKVQLTYERSEKGIINAYEEGLKRINEICK